LLSRTAKTRVRHQDNGRRVKKSFSNKEPTEFGCIVWSALRRKNQRKSQGTAGRISSARNPPIGALPADRDGREMALCNDKNGTSIPPSAESA
jgi:hypothetical protein